MASLKEVKTRISSVNSTRKITSAMKMVASSKLHQAQSAIEKMRPYQQKLNLVLNRFLSTMDGDLDTSLSVQREVKTVALVVFSSNSSLCGGFNSIVIKALQQAAADYRKQGVEIVVYPFGKKVSEAARKLGLTIGEELSASLDNPSYPPVAALAQRLVSDFNNQHIDRVELIYQHFKSAGSQILTRENFLPLVLSSSSPDNSSSPTSQPFYLVEPNAEEIIAELLPKVLNLQIFATLLDSLAAEHAARVVAMQTATDNADELLRSLTLQYNKTRQQAITSELLDIVGGSMQ